jgi:hypothetical protein
VFSKELVGVRSFDEKRQRLVVVVALNEWTGKGWCYLQVVHSGTFPDTPEAGKRTMTSGSRQSREM